MKRCALSITYQGQERFSPTPRPAISRRKIPKTCSEPRQRESKAATWLLKGLIQRGGMKTTASLTLSSFQASRWDVFKPSSSAGWSCCYDVWSRGSPDGRLPAVPRCPPSFQGVVKGGWEQSRGFCPCWVGTRPGTCSSGQHRSLTSTPTDIIRVTPEMTWANSSKHTTYSPPNVKYISWIALYLWGK